jgi:hypothetical protein
MARAGVTVDVAPQLRRKIRPAAARRELRLGAVLRELEAEEAIATHEIGGEGA